MDSETESYRAEVREAIRGMRQSLADLVNEQARQATQLSVLMAQVGERCPAHGRAIDNVKDRLETLERDKSKMIGIVSVAGIAATAIAGLIGGWIEKHIK